MTLFRAKKYVDKVELQPETKECYQKAKIPTEFFEC